MIEQLHLAAQYLAAFGNSFLENKADDSQANLAWNDVDRWLMTRAVSDDTYQLALSFQDFKLIWLANGQAQQTLELNDTSHTQVLTFINEQVNASAIAKPYSYCTNYPIPYPALTDASTFKLVDEHRMWYMANKLTMAKLCFQQFLKTHQLASEIRVWPHHFDMGIYAPITDSLAIGAGLAIPDSLVPEDFYCYISGWLKGEAIDNSVFNALTLGRWHTDDFNGATLPVTNLMQEDVSLFLKETYNAIKQTKV